MSRPVQQEKLRRPPYQTFPERQGKSGSQGGEPRDRAIVVDDYVRPPFSRRVHAASSERRVDAAAKPDSLLLPHHAIQLTARRKSRSASRHRRIGFPTRRSYGAVSSTLYAGRVADAGRDAFHAAEVVGLSSASFRSNSSSVAAAKSNQLVWPALVTCHTPVAPRSSSSSVASARSCVNVGEPTWSATTLSGLPARATLTIVCGNDGPPGPYSHAVRMISQRAGALD